MKSDNGHGNVAATPQALDRRGFIRGSAAIGLLAGLHRYMPAYAMEATGQGASSGNVLSANGIDLLIREEVLDFGARRGTAITINGTVPGPLVRLREGSDAILRVTNHLAEGTSIHWHGLLLPPGMDGVPGVSYAGIKTRETFTYRFPVRQNGTYWYHSHSAGQEQAGQYGPLIIDAAGPEPFQYDCEHVIVLSDWTSESPSRVLARLKRRPNYYNAQRRTVGTFFRDVAQNGFRPTVLDRLEWARMRMDPSDISDVTGYTYTYLMNGLAPDSNWTALFQPGERIRLRIINAGAATYFDLRIPGLPMTVVSVDGQHVQPVTVDEIRIAIAETYDVIVEPQQQPAYTVYAEAMDRSGYARGTLATKQGMKAALPAQRKPAIATMADMGMGSMAGMNMPPAAVTKGIAAPAASDDMAGMPGMSTATPATTVSAPTDGPIKHGRDHHGPGNSSVPLETKSRLTEPGTGLESTGTRVLLYSDLRSLKPGEDSRPPGREIELHLTGHMERYLWGFDGKTFAESAPIRFSFGERVRLTLVNDTMMNHPIHLHGMFMELDNGAGEFKPRKHTVNVKPAERLSLDITANERGNWAFHCHILYHMEMGMFRVVSVAGSAAGDAS